MRTIGCVSAKCCAADPAKPEPWTGEAWHFRIELEDSSFVNQRERSTKGQTNSASESLMQLAKPVR
jgi:hypothetical protein